MHEWIGDGQQTPHIVVDASWPGVVVPQQYVQGGKIILNVSLNATSSLSLGNDFVCFRARFSGVTHDISIPIGAVLGIYARETGQGMIFSDADAPPPQPTTPVGPAATASAAAPAPKPGADGPKRTRPTLKVVK